MVVNDSPVDCQSRGRPSAPFARDRVLLSSPKTVVLGGRFFVFGVAEPYGEQAATDAVCGGADVLAVRTRHYIDKGRDFFGFVKRTKETPRDDGERPPFLCKFTKNIQGCEKNRRYD